MSIISDEEVLAGFVKSIRVQVGDELSTLLNAVDSLGNPLKAVIQDIQDGVRPEYPFIVVNLVTTDEDANSWLRSEYIDENDVVHYVTDERIKLKVTCYGGNSSTILKKLRIYSLSDDIRTSMDELTQATFVDYTDIKRKPEFLSTDFINTSTMTAIFAVTNDWYSSTSGGIIEVVTGEASYLNSESDNTPISVPIDTTSS
jgi:hypothetical protein